MVLNTAVAEGIDALSDKLEKELKKSKLETALGKILRQTLGEIESIIFNGDGYSDEWQEEAAKRGLLNMKTTADALPVLADKKNSKLFSTYKVLNKRELHSRLEILAEQYNTTITIEVDTTESIAKTMVYPAATQYLHNLAKAADEVKDHGLEPTGTLDMLKTVNDGVNALGEALDGLRKAQEKVPHSNVLKTAKYMQTDVIPAMNAVRDAVDFLERYVSDELWPLPVYREMLFVK